ncbi:MAG: DMT family transporter [Neisseria sp.]|nr:DMT family transporter [Neisseria sp.]
MQAQHRGILFIIFATLCWGSLGLLGSLLNRTGLTGTQVATLRIVIAAAILCLLLPYFYRLARHLTISNVPMWCVQSLIGMLGMSMFYFAAVSRIGVSLSVALLYTAPIWSLLFSRLILHEIISKRAMILTIIAALGVAFSMAGKSSLDILGIVFGLASGMCYALYGVLGKRVMNNTPPMLLLFSSVSISAIVLLMLPATHTTLQQFIALPVSAWFTAIALAFVGTILAFAAYIKGLQSMPASKAAIFTVFEPLTAVLLAAWLLDEQLNQLQYLGIAMIVAVALLNTRNPKASS